MIVSPEPSRRQFLKTSGSCLAYLSGTVALAGSAELRRWIRPRGPIVAQEAWGYLEDLGPGLWALISTPLGGDYTTLSNGGIIQGRQGVLVVEGTATPEGARWMAERARALTGRAPTHVVVTHHHGDHARGVDGLAGESAPPRLRTTAATRDRVAGGIDASAEPERASPWADVDLLDAWSPTEIDLGDRTVVIRPYDGHTESDVIVDLPEAGITWCGDLVWNGMFPNYVDATPSRLTESVRAIVADGRTTYVPGHGGLADAGDVRMYASILDHIEAAARDALARGQSAESAGAAYALPAEAGVWALFFPRYFERALDAWLRELAPDG